MAKDPLNAIPKKRGPIGKILIVEDEISLQKALNDTLAHEGFEVLTAGNGKTGLKSALDNRPDLIILDILMPVMDGMTMLKKLRKDPWGMHVFVILLTNHEPGADLETESERAPHRSIYLTKCNIGISDIVKMAKDKIKQR
jgi:CheY-like chemotaxis protein